MSSGNADAGVLDKPASVQQVVQLASQPFFENQYPILRWFRTGDVMLKQVCFHSSSHRLSILTMIQGQYLRA